MFGFSTGAQRLEVDFLLAESAGKVFICCPPSSVVERVLGKNEVTGSIPVGGS